MSALRSWCDAVYWLALTLWVSVLVAAAVAATATFSILPDLGLTIGSLPVAPDEHGRIAAGRVMEPVFTFVDVAQLAVAAVVAVMVVIQWVTGRRRWTNVVRTAALVVAMALLGYRVVAVAPPMNLALRTYWSALEAGDLERAESHRMAFARDHPRASRLLTGTLGALLVAVVLSPAALAPRRPAETPT